MVTLTREELDAYARELFRSATTAFADAEDSLVNALVDKIVAKHTKPLLNQGHYIMHGSRPIKMPHDPIREILMPRQQNQRQLEIQWDLVAQANEAESRI